MALGKSSRTDIRRSSSGYCSTIAIFVFVALCLVGVWVMTSQSVVPFPTVSEASLENSGEEKEQVRTPTNESSSQHYKDSQGFLPDDAIRGGSNEGETQEEKIEEKTDDKSDEDSKSDEESNKRKQDETSKSDYGTEETKTEDGDGNSEEQESDGQKPDRNYHSDDNEKNPDEVEDKNVLKSDGNSTDEQEQEKNNQQEPSGEDIDNSQMKNETLSDILPSSAQSELLNETMAANVSFPTQATESKNEKDTQLSSDIKKDYSWKLCNTTAGPDFIPCLDNWLAIRSLRSTKHYEHRERHCPQEPPTCLVPLPEGYKRPIQWPKSREKIWYDNVPHTKLAEYKGHQNWVKVSGEYLTFPGGGTQFKHGASHYIEFIQRSVPDIAWGKRTRVILDVGCGVASFGGFLFDKDVLTMSLAPKDEHEAQVQFALERGIPAISAVMGTQRLPFPGRVFDAVHCARCRVPWHIEGGKLLLELNRVLRPGGFFVWSATPVYQKLSEDVGIWKAMSKLTKDMCWELVSINKDTVNGVGVATFRKPASNECYKSRSQQEPPLCSLSDDPNAAWHVPLQACMHNVPEDKTERGSQWPEQWPARMEKPPYWLSSSQVGVYGKTAPEDFAADYEHWKRVMTKSYLKGLGINWSSVRNVMDMRAVYGGFAAALRDLNMWVMNVVPIDSADTLPIIYERGLFGIYHDWCESFSTYPRSYDLLHADHLFSKIKSRCNFVAVIAEVDRMLRPEGKLIIRDNVETINKLETVVKSMNWEIRMTYYAKDNEGLLCVQKTFWRPRESEELPYATI